MYKEVFIIIRLYIALIFRREVAGRILRRRYFTTHTCAGILFNLLQCKQHFDLGSYVHVRSERHVINKLLLAAVAGAMIDRKSYNIAKYKKYV